VLPAQLREEIVECGYFPEFVMASIARAIGGEEVVGHLVHHEATFNHEAVGRHLSVMVLTPTRLILTHTDEGALPGEAPHAITTVESVALRQVCAVAVSELASDPEEYTLGDVPAEAWMSIGWGTMRRIELEPAGCGDPECEADHGYSGALATDDLLVRMSVAADGAEKVAQLIEFGTQLQVAAR
jgi:hypothetical protein